jgi:hypothetical protein
VNQDGGDDAALEVLNGLDLARGDDGAVAARHLVQAGLAGPKVENREEDYDDDQQQVREPMRTPPAHAGGLGHEIGVFPGLAAGQDRLPVFVFVFPRRRPGSAVTRRF